jgi:hypothetical protein
MARDTASRGPRRVNVIALGVTLVCLVLVGWAVRGLLQDPVPTTADFGTIGTSDVRDLASAGSAAPSPAASSSSAASSPSSGPTPAPTTGSIPQPGRSSAALPPVEERAQPVRLTVESLDLEVAIDPVAIAEDGQMEIPEEPDRAGWYRHGPGPGSDTGSVVMAGHVDTTTGPGAFLGLTRVAEGAEVVVELNDGTSTAYRVVGGENVAKTDLAVDEIFRRDGDPVLRLVTCTGEWSPQTGHYTDNLVITAVPVQ